MKSDIGNRHYDTDGNYVTIRRKPHLKTMKILSNYNHNLFIYLIRLNYSILCVKIQYFLV